MRCLHSHGPRGRVRHQLARSDLDAAAVRTGDDVDWLRVRNVIPECAGESVLVRAAGRIDLHSRENCQQNTADRLSGKQCPNPFEDRVDP